MEVERKVPPPPPKSLPAEPQPLAAEVHGYDPISLDETDVKVETAILKPTAPPLEIKVNDNQKVAASEDASKTSELHHDGITSPVNPFHKQRKAPMIIDLEAMENVKSPEVLKSENTSETFILHPPGLLESVDAYAREESHSQTPVKIGRSSTRDKATTQSEIPKSWLLRSNDK